MCARMHAPRPTRRVGLRAGGDPQADASATTPATAECDNSGGDDGAESTVRLYAEEDQLLDEKVVNTADKERLTADK